jgi:hypothetical protein
MNAMTRSKGKPSGKGKVEGTGIPSNIQPGNMGKDEELTREYTENDEQLAEKVRTKHPNRNVNKNEATNAGGYKN